MRELPPPLAWLPSFANSLSGAIDSPVQVECTQSVNPLVYIVKFRFGEKVTGKRMMLVWNLYQQYAAKNDSIPQGRVETEGNTLTTTIIVKRRLGPPRNEHPLA
ncbi:MAG: hypothetical protein E6R04_02875 [Spirochaetes bacterium]|nr:MAG: hypothetical protein E6R04_02875 [Spirochaetota bacterium]